MTTMPTTALPPTLLERVLRALEYLCLAAAAVWVVLVPAGSQGTVGSQLGYLLTVIWAGFLATAAPCAWAALRGRYRAEFALLPWCGGAVVLAAIGTGVRTFENPAYLGRELLIIVIVLCLALRWLALLRLIGLVNLATPPTKDGD